MDQPCVGLRNRFVLKSICAQKLSNSSSDIYIYIFYLELMTLKFIVRHNFGFTYLSDSSENQLILHVLVLLVSELLVRPSTEGTKHRDVDSLKPASTLKTSVYYSLAKTVFFKNISLYLELQNVPPILDVLL